MGCSEHHLRPVNRELHGHGDDYISFRYQRSAQPEAEQDHRLHVLADGQWSCDDHHGDKQSGTADLRDGQCPNRKLHFRLRIHDHFNLREGDKRQYGSWLAGRQLCLQELHRQGAVDFWRRRNSHCTELSCDRWYIGCVGWFLHRWGWCYARQLCSNSERLPRYYDRHNTVDAPRPLRHNAPKHQRRLP